MKIAQWPAAMVAVGFFIAGPAMAQTTTQPKATSTQHRAHKQPSAGGGAGGGGGGTDNPLPSGATKQQTSGGGGGGGGGGTDNPLPAAGSGNK
jgi:hypothetical protein